MSLEVYYAPDIHNALLAAEQATREAGADGEYLRGYLAALNTLALNFGLATFPTLVFDPSRIVDGVVLDHALKPS